MPFIFNPFTKKLDNSGGSSGYTAENVANKATDFSTVDDTLYPTVKAVENRVATNEILTAKLSLTSAQILTLGTAINFGLPAPGAGKAIVPISAFWSSKNGTVVYSTNTNLNIRHVGSNTNLVSASSAPLLSTGAHIGFFTQQTGVTNGNQIMPNADIQVIVTGGNPTGGNGDLDLYVYYKIQTL